jgi:hypothetical protein
MDSPSILQEYKRVLVLEEEKSVFRGYRFEKNFTPKNYSTWHCCLESPFFDEYVDSLIYNWWIVSIDKNSISEVIRLDEKKFEIPIECYDEFLCFKHSKRTLLVEKNSALKQKNVTIDINLKLNNVVMRNGNSYLILRK